MSCWESLPQEVKEKVAAVENVKSVDLGATFWAKLEQRHDEWKQNLNWDSCSK